MPLIAAQIGAGLDDVDRLADHQPLDILRRVAEHDRNPPPHPAAPRFRMNVSLPSNYIDFGLQARRLGVRSNRLASELMPRVLSFSLAAGLMAVCSPALAQDADDDEGPGRPETEITITARRLDSARENINPALGASVYTLTNDSVEGRPSGETTTIASILLQAPGIALDASGQIRLRQSQGVLQYRINNVILPDGLTDPGDTLSARLASKIDLVTGALPAQYGLQAGGVVNITTKDGIYLGGGQAEIYGGSHGTLQPAVELAGSAGPYNYFVTGQYQRNNAGLASTDGSASPIHDRSSEGEVFSYVDRVLGTQDRVSLIVSTSGEHFEIPDPRGNVDLVPLGANRQNANHFAVLSLLHKADQFTLQVSGFARSSLEVLDTSDPGDIAWFEFGSRSRQTQRSFGVQVEFVYVPAPSHTLRGGITASSGLNQSSAITLAHPVDSASVPTSGTLRVVQERERRRRSITSLFLQDEWRLSNEVILNWGGRIDHVDDLQAQTALSPRTSLVWRPGSDTTLHLGYARYFLPATLDAESADPGLFAGISAQLASDHSDAIRSETDDYFDLGAQQKVGALTLGIDAYWRNARGLLDEVRLAGSYRTVPFNFARGRIRGIELSAAYAEDGLSAWANLNIGQARGTQIISNQAYFAPDVLSYVATHDVATSGTQSITASGGVAYRWDGFRLSAAFRLGSGLPRTDAITMPNGGHLPAYAQIDVSAVWRIGKFIGKPLDIRVDVVNLFDTRYQLSDGTGLAPGPRSWGPRRGLFFGLEQGF